MQIAKMTTALGQVDLMVGQFREKEKATFNQVQAMVGKIKEKEK